MKIYAPAYYRDFKCIASACPDSCCHGWTVDIDEAAAARYLAMPGSLGDKLRRHLKLESWGWVLTLEDNGRCPMWREDGLCRIHAEAGEEALSQVCAAFPRLRHDYGSFRELGLELSCPEAARLILTSPVEASVTEEIPGGEAPEYDTEAMEVLLRTRQEMLALLSGRPVGEALALGLLYGYHAQALLDGADPSPFDANAALDTARSLAKPADPGALPAFFSDLEILTDDWRRRLASPAPTAWQEPLRAMARYGVERYWLQAVSDYDLINRVKLITASCLLVKTLGGDLIRTAQLWSKEVENDADNVDAILDAAFTHPAFADERLLWLLLEGE